jgi:hypothetical protein
MCGAVFDPSYGAEYVRERALTSSDVVKVLLRAHVQPRQDRRQALRDGAFLARLDGPAGPIDEVEVVYDVPVPARRSAYSDLI